MIRINPASALLGGVYYFTFVCQISLTHSLIHWLPRFTVTMKCSCSDFNATASSNFPLKIPSGVAPESHPSLLVPALASVTVVSAGPAKQVCRPVAPYLYPAFLYCYTGDNADYGHCPESCCLSAMALQFQYPLLPLQCMVSTEEGGYESV